VAVRAGVESGRVEGADLAELARKDEYRHWVTLAVMMAVARPDELALDIDRLLADGGFFCTIRSAAESTPPARIGDCLVVLATQATPDGRFAVYQKIAPSGQGDNV